MRAPCPPAAAVTVAIDWWARRCAFHVARTVHLDRVFAPPCNSVKSHASRIPGRHAADRIGDTAVGALERVDAFDLIVAERKVEYGEIFGDAARVRRARDRCHN